MICARCGHSYKAGMMARPLIQKAKGLTCVDEADRDEVRSGDTFPGQCPNCDDEEGANL